MEEFNLRNEVPPTASAAWKPEPGEVVTGEITYLGTSIQDSYDKKRKEKQLRIDLQRDPDGQKVTIYAVLDTDYGTDEGYPSRLARAITRAVDEGTSDGNIRNGGILTVQRAWQDVPTEMGSPAKDFVARYEPPARQLNLIQGGAQGGPSQLQPNLQAVAPQPAQPANSLLPPPAQAPVGIGAQPAMAQTLSNPPSALAQYLGVDDAVIQALRTTDPSSLVTAAFSKANSTGQSVPPEVMAQLTGATPAAPQPLQGLLPPPQS